MKDFALLFQELDQTTKTNERIAALVRYLTHATDEDKLWTIALLSGNRPKRKVNSTRMKEWVAELADIPMWLFEESYHVVGDLAETISLLLPHESVGDAPLKSLTEWIQAIIMVGERPEEEKKAFVLKAWRELNRDEVFVFNKLIGGSFRVGVSQKNMVKALAKFTGKNENELAHRIMGKWSPDDHTFHELILADNENADISRPYPFYLAYQLDEKADFNAKPDEWFAERKWDGIRGQVIKRNDETFVWTRGEELVTDKYPELALLNEVLPNGVALDGEIIGFANGQILSFNHLQKRIGRKTLSKKLLQEIPVKLLAYDLMEFERVDIRSQPLEQRRSKLEKLVSDASHPNLLLSDLLQFSDLEELTKLRENARAHLSEGLMLKRKNSTYKVGRKRGDWWKWKVDPW